jgi:RNA polymerase sigma-70 factor, ECF subfamily
MRMEPMTCERNGPGRAKRADHEPSVGLLTPTFDGEHVDGVDHQVADSFEELVREHLTPLYSAALRLTHDWAEAEDLVQDTLERAYGAFHRYRAESKARAWLGRIMRNLWISERRRHEDALRTIPLDGIEEAMPDCTASDALSVCDVEAAVLEGLGVASIVGAIDALPQHLRQVVILADLGDDSYGTIAEMLGVPVGTVASRLCRGRRRLQEVLRDQARGVGFLARAS